MSKRSRPLNRPARTVLISVSGKVEEILPSGDRDLVDLLGIEPADLTALSFGIKSTMWMSRSKQLDQTVPVNRPATDALRLVNALPVVIRGPVIVRHEEADLSHRQRSQHRHASRPS